MAREESVRGAGRRLRAKYRPAELLPNEMPPVSEWDNPALKRRADDFGDRMRLRRARIAGAATGRPVVRRLIIARDESTCWICKRVTPEDEIYLDHVIPIAGGGLHDPENVRVACASCNSWKGTRILAPEGRLED